MVCGGLWCPVVVCGFQADRNKISNWKTNSRKQSVWSGIPCAILPGCILVDTWPADSGVGRIFVWGAHRGAAPRGRGDKGGGVRIFDYFISKWRILMHISGILIYFLEVLLCNVKQNIYTEWSKKSNPKYSTHNLVKYWPIFLLLLQSPKICNN